MYPNPDAVVAQRSGAGQAVRVAGTPPREGRRDSRMGPARGEADRADAGEHAIWFEDAVRTVGAYARMLSASGDTPPAWLLRELGQIRDHLDAAFRRLETERDVRWLGRAPRLPADPSTAVVTRLGQCRAVGDGGHGHAKE